MSTNSRIAIVNPNGSVQSVYCHWGGYPSWVGRMLLDYYNDEKKIKDLIALGSISSLKEKLEPSKPVTHSFDNPEKNITIAYNRDRGDRLDIDVYQSVSEWSLYNERLEFNYVWKDGAWYFNCSTDKDKYTKRLTKLTPYHVSEKAEIY